VVKGDVQDAKAVLLFKVVRYVVQPALIPDGMRGFAEDCANAAEISTDTMANDRIAIIVR
jgi:hypothetical protein